MDQLAEVLRPYKNIALRVVGHTDSTGPEEYNVALSKRRAEAVAKYLERKANTRMSIVTEGRGSKQPMVPHDSANRKLNRRTVIYIREIQEG